MAGTNVEIVRGALAAFNARDLDSMLAITDPDVEWVSTFAAVFGAVYHGHDGVRQWHRDMEDTWDHEIHVEGKLVLERDDRVLLLAMLHARGRQSGIEVSVPIAQIWTFRSGLLTQCKTYTEQDDALRDFDASADALMPLTS